MKRQWRLGRLRKVEREYRTADLALDFLRAGMVSDPAALPNRGLRPRDADAFEESLEATYLIRLFAEFEAALRDLWANGFHRTTEPPTRGLMDGIAARRGIPDQVLQDAHRVRDHRNALVHEGNAADEETDFDEARSALGTYLSWFPLTW